jgi:hypothetical protein
VKLDCSPLFKWVATGKEKCSMPGNRTRDSLPLQFAVDGMIRRLFEAFFQTLALLILA